MKRINQAQTLATPAPNERMVLYVEDENSNWEVTELNLRSRFKLLWAKTDVDACEVVRRHGPALHAILMDIQLKGSQLDGLSLAKVIRGHSIADAPDYTQGLPTLSCPLFFVTAYGNFHSVEEMREAGGDSHVPKPVDFVKLSMLLAQSRARRAINSP
jgi:CheY-like chemotaxis protein